MPKPDTRTVSHGDTQLLLAVVGVGGVVLFAALNRPWSDLEPLWESAVMALVFAMFGIWLGVSLSLLLARLEAPPRWGFYLTGVGLLLLVFGVVALVSLTDAPALPWSIDPVATIGCAGSLLSAVAGYAATDWFKSTRSNFDPMDVDDEASRPEGQKTHQGTSSSPTEGQDPRATD